jgi:hypothetical protein
VWNSEPNPWLVGRNAKGQHVPKGLCHTDSFDNE